MCLFFSFDREYLVKKEWVVYKLHTHVHSLCSLSESSKEIV